MNMVPETLGYRAAEYALWGPDSDHLRFDKSHEEALREKVTEALHKTELEHSLLNDFAYSRGLFRGMLRVRDSDVNRLRSAIKFARFLINFQNTGGRYGIADESEI